MKMPFETPKEALKEMDHMIGNKEAKEMLMMDYMFEGKEGATTILLGGPPGVGKTEFVKIIAKIYETDVEHINASDINGPYVGESEGNVKLFFETAIELCKTKKVIMFFDEADALLSQRKKTDSEHSQGVKQELLTQIETARKGVEYNAKDLIIVMATNFPDRLDSATKQRFEHKIFLQLPTQKESHQAIIKFCNDKNIDMKFSMDDLRHLDTNLLSFRELNTLVTQAHYRGPKLRSLKATHFKRVVQNDQEDYVYEACLETVNDTCDKSEKKMYEIGRSKKFRHSPLTLNDLISERKFIKQSITEEEYKKLAENFGQSVNIHEERRRKTEKRRKNGFEIVASLLAKIF